MITTCTILNGRVAIAGDYTDGVTVRGEPMRNGPMKIGGTHLVIDFDFIGERQIAFNGIRDMDSGAPKPLHLWPRPTVEALEAHCRAYANKHPHLRKDAS